MGFARKKAPPPSLGYKRGFAEAYSVQRELGRGGNGVVRLATQLATGSGGGLSQAGTGQRRQRVSAPREGATTPSCLPARLGAILQPCCLPAACCLSLRQLTLDPVLCSLLTCSGRSFAVKSIPKVLEDPAASERKKAEQIPYLKREVGRQEGGGGRRDGWVGAGCSTPHLRQQAQCH